MATLRQRRRLRKAKEARSVPFSPFVLHPLSAKMPLKGTSATRRYFQKDVQCLKIFFQGMKKFFQALKKLFQALENFFSSTGVFLENISASPSPYLRTAERRGDFGFGITEDCKSMFYDDERLVLAANGLRFLAFS